LALIEVLGTVWVAVALLIVGLDHGLGLVLPKWLVRSLIFSHFPLFFVGILIYLNRVHGFSVRRVGLMILCIAAVGVTLGPVHALVAAPLAVLATFAVSKQGHLLVNRPLLFLGAISYSLYLSHRVLGYALLTDLHHRGWSTAMALAFTIAMALLLATLVTFLVERPSCTWLRARYRNWRSNRASSAA
jgi:peptidoglycan/LPS O-acetylase OafA/YrhL